MDISIIIPVFQEQNKVAADIEAVADFLKTRQLCGEIIVVDDGSADQTRQVAEATPVAGEVELRVINYEGHRGKGFAVRTGMANSKGDFVMFADSGNCVPYDNALIGLKMLESGECDLAHGSRKLRESNIRRPHKWYRRIYSFLFQRLVIFVMNIPPELTDTQCGFKVYRGEVARPLYRNCVSDGFMFDIEIILRARKQGCRIMEFPVEWTADLDSRTTQNLRLGEIMRELLQIRRALKNSD